MNGVFSIISNLFSVRPELVEGLREFFSNLPVWYLRSSFKKVQTMRATELVLKSPSIPLFFKGGKLQRWEVERKNLKSAIRSGFRFPSLKKRGQGRFLGGVRRELFSELLTQDTRVIEQRKPSHE